MQRIWNIGLVALAIVVLGAAAYVVAHNSDPSSARADRGSRATPSGTVPPTSAPTTGVATAPAVASTSAPDRPVVAFLGDDWTSGAGASSQGRRFSTVVSRQLALTERNFGGAGSGYAKSGPTAGPYRSRVAAVVAAHPDVVVVSGGRNDRGDSASTAATAAQDLFATLRDKLPDATLVAVAPFWGDSDTPPEVTALSKAVKKAVTAVGGRYLDIHDPIHGHPDFMHDDADPDDQGYAAIAASVSPRIGALLPDA